MKTRMRTVDVIAYTIAFAVVLFGSAYFIWHATIVKIIYYIIGGK